MKVLHVMTHFSVSSGVARLVASLIPFQIEQGHKVDVAVLADSPLTYAEEMKKYGCGYILLNDVQSSRYNPKFIVRLIPYLKRYDIVHVHMFPPIYWAVIAKMLSKAQCRLIMTEHSTLNNRQGKWLWKCLDYFIYRRYDALIAISDATKESLHKFVDNCLPVEVIANGISVSRFQNAVPISRIRLGIPDNVVLLIQVASFHEQKDQLTLLKAMRKLSKKFHVIFVGAGDTLDMHKQKAEEYGISERVHFMGVRQGVPALMKASDIVVMSSHFEGFGLVAVEGMAAGKPVIASGVPGLQEVIQGAGVVFPVHDDTVLANEILRLSKDKSYANEIINKCRKRADEYDIRFMAEKYNKVYKRIVEKSLYDNIL